MDSAINSEDLWLFNAQHLYQVTLQRLPVFQNTDKEKAFAKLHLATILGNWCVSYLTKNILPFTKPIIIIPTSPQTTTDLQALYWTLRGLGIPSTVSLGGVFKPYDEVRFFEPHKLDYQEYSPEWGYELQFLDLTDGGKYDLEFKKKFGKRVSTQSVWWFDKRGPFIAVGNPYMVDPDGSRPDNHHFVELLV